jgi:hypothetical protein
VKKDAYSGVHHKNMIFINSKRRCGLWKRGMKKERRQQVGRAHYVEPELLATGPTVRHMLEDKGGSLYENLR